MLQPQLLRGFQHQELVDIVRLKLKGHNNGLRFGA